MEYINNELCLGPKRKVLQKYLNPYGGPIYMYDLDFVKERYNTMSHALGEARLFYAMKANSNKEILRSLRDLGAGVDVVSGGEITRALNAGFSPQDIIYSGVGKTKKEIAEALQLEILQINVESVPELLRIAGIAQQMGKKASVVLRLNPDIDIKTHPYIATGLKDNKFGMDLADLSHLERLFEKYSPSLTLRGLSLHLGSQMFDLSSYREALRKLRPVFETLQARFDNVERFDIGGGLGIFYDRFDLQGEEKLLLEYALITSEELKGLRCAIQGEPGRWLVGHCGVLVAEVQYVKRTSRKNFIILDSGMNHLLRPALYQTSHRILPLTRTSTEMIVADIVGPICESADVFLKDYSIPKVKEGDLVAILDAGAYGYSMANIYNLQKMPEEKCI